jgi:hypothetical protein
LSTRKISWRLFVVAVVVVAAGAYHFLWPRFSSDRWIDPKDVFLVVIPEVRETYEVHRDRDPALLKRLVRALNGGREKFVQIKLAVGGVIVLHRRHGPSILIRYGRVRPGGGMVFREPPRPPRGGSMDLYRSDALATALKAIRSRKGCAVKRPSISARSVSRIDLYSAAASRAIRGDSQEANRIVASLNAFLQSVDTSLYAILDDPAAGAFYEGRADPAAHLGGTTGALVTLNPPLSMHTTMMFWESHSGPPAEYRRFNTRLILISDAISVRGKAVVGFSSDVGLSRFYLFYRRSTGDPSDAARSQKQWQAIIAAIQEVVLTQQGR